MVLRWFKEATDIRVLARDAGVSIATAYRYLHEAIDVIAAHAVGDGVVCEDRVERHRPRGHAFPMALRARVCDGDRVTWLRSARSSPHSKPRLVVHECAAGDVHRGGGHDSGVI
jgi:hypothetical protein